MLFFRIIIFLCGVGIVAYTLFSAIKTFVLPRSIQDRLTKTVFIIIRWIFSLALLRTRSFRERDRILAYYAPISLLMLVPVWLSLISLGYTGMFWAIGTNSVFEAFRISGSSILTLGFFSAESLPEAILMFTAAALGLIMIALLIAYLPTMYAAFARREILVNLLEVRAGSPPSSVEMLIRFHRIHGLDRLADQWIAWEIWFSDIEESHTSLPALVFFRSPKPEHSWVTASAAILDSAALTLSSIDIADNPNAALCIRAGYLALRSIADYFNLPYPTDPHYPDVSISLSRAEFEAALDVLAQAGVPIKADREQAWINFAGWRVNYDAPLIGMARITMAPDAPWITSQNGNTPSQS